MPVKKPVKWLPLFEAFISNLRIHSKEEASEDERGNPLRLWESQRRVLRDIATGLDAGKTSFYFLKSRQLGCTTVSLAIDLFWVAVHPGLSASIVTDNEDNREKNRAMLRDYVNSFPEDYFGESFKIVKGGDNRLVMRFSNKSFIEFKIAGTRDKGVSWAEGSSHVLNHLTEVGKYSNFDALRSYEESFSQTHPYRLNIYESTGNGFNGWADMFKSAKEDRFTKQATFLGWWSNDMNTIARSDARYAQFGVEPPDHEEREKIQAVAKLYDWKVSREQLAWIRWRIEQDERGGGDLQMLDQNQPWTEMDAFVQSGHSFFQVRALSKDMRVMDDAPVAPVSEQGYAFKGYRYEMGDRFFDMRMVEELEDIGAVELRVWEEPQPEGRYVIGFDPAYGRNDHKDASAISVWRGFADKLVQVAEYACNQHDIKQSSWILAHLAAAYDNAVVNYEVNGPGSFVSLEWDSVRGQLNAEMNAGAVKERNWENALANARYYLFVRPDSSGRPSAKGFSTTFNSKSTLMHGYRGAYATNELVIRSRKLLGEMSNVVFDDGKIGAPESKSENGKDDRVFAAALAHRAWIEWVRPGMVMEGMTFKGVTDIESGQTSMISSRINRQVFQFFQTAEQMAAMEVDNRPKWKADFGLA